MRPGVVALALLAAAAPGGEPRPGEAEAAGASWAAEAKQTEALIRQAVVTGVAAGRKEHVYVDLGGALQRGELASADAAGIVVSLPGVRLPLPWEKLAARDTCSLGRKYLPQDDARVRVRFCRWCLVNGLLAEAGEEIGKVYALDPGLGTVGRDEVSAIADCLRALEAEEAARRARPVLPAKPKPAKGPVVRVEELPPDADIRRANVATDHYEIYMERYDPAKAGLMMEAAYGAWSEFFAATPPGDGKLRVKIYATPERYQAGGARDGHPTPVGGPNMGMYWTGTSIAHGYVTSGEGAMRYIALHEAAHQFHFMARTGNRGYGGGAWYGEGIAIWSGSSAWDGETFALGGGVRPRPLGDRPRTREGMASMNEGLLVFLVTRYPREFRKLAARLDAREDEAAAWREAFGFDEAPADFADEYDALAKGGPDCRWVSWEHFTERRAAAAALAVACYRLGAGAPKSLVGLRRAVQAASAARGDDPASAHAAYARGIADVVRDLGSRQDDPARLAAADLVEVTSLLGIKPKKPSPQVLTGAARPAPAAPAERKPGAEVIAAWDARLLSRTKGALGAGRKLAFFLSLMHGKATLLSADAEARLEVATGPVRTKVEWARLTIADRKSIAVALAGGSASAEDHALAAFYLLAAGEGARAETHLARTGGQAAAIRALFE